MSSIKTIGARGAGTPTRHASRSFFAAGLAMALAFSLVAVVAGPVAAANTTNSVAYITDFGAGLADANPPNPSSPGSSIFTNAITGSPLADGGTYNGATFHDVTLSTIDANPTTALDGFDTAILYQVCTIGSHPAAVGAINAFLAGGGKVMIFDADGCSTNTAGGAIGITADYSGFLFPFTTNSPGPLGAQDEPYTFKETNSLTTGLPAVGTPIPDDAIGDGNVFVTHAGGWCQSLQGKNVNGVNSIIEAYARTAAGGLAIYEGEDFWFTDVHSEIFPSGGDPHLKLVFDNMLAQAWNPDGLPCTNPASGIKLDPADATNPIGTPHTDTATVVNHDGTPDAGVTVTFVVTSGPDAGLTGTDVTDASGHATFTFTDTTAPGTDVVEASFTDATGAVEHSNQAMKHWEKIKTDLLYTGATTSDFNDPATVSAKLTDAGGPIASEPIVFTLNGVETCTANTNASGIASCSITPGEPAGSYPLTAEFAGDATHLKSSASATFTVTLEETTTTYTGPTVIANGVPTTFSGVLKEDGTTPIVGRTLTLTLGTGGSAQSCTTGLTNAAGSASCSITPAQPLGPGTVRADFAGDTFYLPSSDSKATVVFAFLASGAFVIGDGNQATGTSVTFWGAQWSKLNTLSGGVAPNQFKGFAGTTAEPPVCGTGWTTDPGNSTPPPAGPLPAYMGVIVSSAVTNSGSTIAGDTVHIVVVKTDAGYASDPGHAGTGTVVATFC